MTFRDRNLIVQIIPFENRRQILVTHDATEDHRINTLRRDFIANASHELRTPLTVINGFLEIEATTPDLPQEIRQNHMRMMREQGERMQMLVDDMLELTKLESSDFPMSSERVNMHALLEEVHQEAIVLSGGKHNISLHIDGPDIYGSIEELAGCVQ